MIFQLPDDHSRYAVASHVAWGETSADAIIVFDQAVAAHGVPQRLLSDNGAADDTVVRTLNSAGVFALDRVQYLVARRHGFQQVLVITDGDTITVSDLHGEILIEHTRPAPGVTYVGNRGPSRPAPGP